MSKTLLRYPGGKSRAAKEIFSYFPENETVLVSPFFGGGAIELLAEENGWTVHGYDAFDLLVNFWEKALESPNELSESCDMIRCKMNKINFRLLQEMAKGEHGVLYAESKAVIFYALNRSSFSGTTLSGGYSPGHPRFNESSIQRLRDFKAPHLTVDCIGYKASMAVEVGYFMYLDPPYKIKDNLYGKNGDLHKNFNHEEFADYLTDPIFDNWILSYNDDPWIRERYKDYEIIELSWAYGMSNKKGKELLILNVKEEER